MKALLAKTGPLAGVAFPIQGRTLIGRDGDCDIQVIDRGVSRKHACVLEQDDGTVLLRDLRSSNGTLVGNERVVETVLTSGDQIMIGDSRFEYAADAEEPERHSEVDLRIVSGPATQTTVNRSLSDAERADVIARAKAKRAAAMPTARPEPAACCDDALAARAREQGWKFCPACGKAVGA